MNAQLTRGINKMAVSALRRSVLLIMFTVNCYGSAMKCQSIHATIS